MDKLSNRYLFLRNTLSRIITSPIRVAINLRIATPPTFTGYQNLQIYRTHTYILPQIATAYNSLTAPGHRLPLEPIYGFVKATTRLLFALRRAELRFSFILSAI